MESLDNKILELLNESSVPVSSREIAHILNESMANVYRSLKNLTSSNKIAQTCGTENPSYGVRRTIKKYKGLGEKSTNFKEISTPIGLINFLSNTTKLDGDDVFSQYTSLNTAINIISKKYWYLGSPHNMNDGLELQNGLEKRNDIFFSSFMTEQKESIAMWSMYAQPWADGIMISIPAKQFKKWIRDTHVVYEADPRTKEINRDNYVDLTNARLSITRVAYSCYDSNGNLSKLSCGYALNDSFKDINSPLLVGYIKDDAWSYEKEVRLRVDLGKSVSFGGVAIDITDELIDSMTITKGPRFEGDIKARIEQECQRIIHTEDSLFFDKLKRTPCDYCKSKK